MKSITAGVKVGVLTLMLLGSSYVVWKNLAKSSIDGYSLWAGFEDASGLPIGAKVVVAGLEAGRITELAIDGARAKVTFKLRGDIPVWSNGAVIKKATSLLGDMYLEVDPGRAADGVTKLGEGSQVANVVESTSPDKLMRRIEETLPNVDAVLFSIQGLSEDVRRLVQGPIASVSNRVDQLVQKEADTVSDILAKADSSMARIEQITKDIRAISGNADERVNRILASLEEASVEAKTLVTSAKNEVELTGKSVRDKLDRLDQTLGHTQNISRKIDENEGTIGRLVNDPTIADNVGDITRDAKGFLGTLFQMQTYVGLRSEYNVLAGLARHYVSVELHTRPDKYYLVELETGPRGGYPDVTLTFDPAVSETTWTKKTVIEDKLRFTFQFAKRFGWATFRYGLKESTGGVGFDAEGKWWNRSVKGSLDVFDATFNQLPRVKMSAALEVFRHIYLLGGVDDLLNEGETFQIYKGQESVPVWFDKFRYGRDYFVGGMIRFNDEDLAALLTVGGSALSGLTSN